MKVSVTWLKEALRRTMSDSEIVQALERAGIEIEQYHYSKPLDKNIVIGLVTKVVQHPRADRLHIVAVNDGREELSIVCGAPNVRAGLYAPLARIGSVLPDGTTITAAKLRGELSQGMLCSARELGLGDSHEGLLELPDSSEPGIVLCDLYPAASFVDVKTPANRFDLLGVVGLAREVAAMTENELVELPVYELAGDASDKLVGELDDGCPRFMVAELELKPGTLSPDWMVARLAASGLRSLGLAVDITNYVMLETAQPMHAYDATRLTLPFGVRAAVDGERLTTLDDQDRKLSDGDLVVTAGGEIVGLAGVRGGAATEISSTTTHIYLEAAVFQGPKIRAAAKRANLRTDASARYERGLPVELAKLALERAIYLFCEYAGATVVRYGEAGSAASARPAIKLTAEHASRVIGVELAPEELAAALTRLGLVGSIAREAVTITPPWRRPDLNEPEDLIEEVVRVIGYEAVPSTLPAWQPRQLVFDYLRPALSRLRSQLSGAGLFEVMTYSFVSAAQLQSVAQPLEAHLKLQNPLSVEQAYLRTSLLGSHLAVAERNRHYAKDLSFYEISNVFLPQAAGAQPEEPLALGIMIVRQDMVYRQVKGWLDAIGRLMNVEFELAGVALQQPWAPGRVAEIRLGGKAIGVIGQLHPEVTHSHKLAGETAYMELRLAPLLAAAAPVQAVRRSRFPEARRDITVIVPEGVTWQSVAAALAKLTNVTIEFGSDYSSEQLPAAHKSLSLKLRLSRDDQTPTEAEIAELEVKVRSILRRSFGATEQL